LNIKVKLAAILLCAGVLLSIPITYLYHHTNAPAYDLQVGQERSFEHPGILDQQSIYPNNKQLWAVVIYPDNDDKMPAAMSRVYVIAKATSRIIQEQSLKESSDTAAEEIPLHNSSWPSGDYAVCFEKNNHIIKQVDFTLQSL